MRRTDQSFTGVLPACVCVWGVFGCVVCVVSVCVCVCVCVVCGVCMCVCCVWVRGCGVCVVCLVVWCVCVCVCVCLVVCNEGTSTTRRPGPYLGRCSTGNMYVCMLSHTVITYKDTTLLKQSP